MPKYSFQDIRPTRKKKVKKTTTPAKVTAKKTGTKPEKHWSSISARKDNPKTETRSHSQLLLWSAVLISTMVVIIAIGSMFTNASVNIIPKQEKSVIKGVFTSTQSTSDVEADTTHKVMTLNAEEYAEIDATQEREVNKKATGFIVVYNKHSASNQRLVKNTRFETPDGKIYKTRESIVVPGTTVVEGEIIPGSTTVQVWADEPGEEYNIDLSDFTIPGFEGQKKYETIFARSKTEMSGGFSGMLKYPNEEELASTIEHLKKTLTEKLKAQALAQKPNNFILYDKAIFITFDTADGELETTDDKIKIVQKATLQATLFNEEDFSKFIAHQSLANFEGEAVKIPQINDLDFIIVNEDDFDLTADTISFSISGNINIVWYVDKESLKEKLAGTPIKELEESLRDESLIEKTTASIKPFWVRTFPEDPKNITIKEIID